MTDLLQDGPGCAEGRRYARWFADRLDAMWLLRKAHNERMTTMTTLDIAPERAELVAAWNDLPDSIRCHPGLKRLFRAAQCIPSEAAPSLTGGERAALVPVETLDAWKSMANSLAVLSLKSERARVAVALKQLIQAEIDDAQAPQVAAQVPNEINGLGAENGPQVAAQAPPAARAEPLPHVIKERDAYAKELAACRDAFPIPDHGAKTEGAWMMAMGDPLAVADYVRAALAQPAAQAEPVAHISGVARYKVNSLIEQGYRVCGYTMEREGHRSAVLFDAAVRWLTDEQRHALMFVEGSVICNPPAQGVKPLPGFIRREVERAISEGINPRGMTLNDGKTRIGTDKLQYLLAWIDRAAIAQAPAATPTAQEGQKT